MKEQVELKRKTDYSNKSVVKKSISKPTVKKIKSAITKVFNEPHPKNFELLEHYLTFVSQHVKKGDPFNHKQDCLSNLSPILFENMMHNIRLKQVPPKSLDLTVVSRQFEEPKENDDSYVIKCICNSPDEEFGDMVQCDKCLSWLHIDCLKLDKKDLEDSFYCPPCGNTSSSRSLEDVLELSDELSEEEDDDGGSAVVVKSPQSLSIEISAYDSEHSPDSALSSNVGTPQDEASVQDPTRFLINQQGLSTLAKRSKKPILSPFAANVFFGIHKTRNKNPLMRHGFSTQIPSQNESLPSTMCHQEELAEFSFDNGPFFN
ncbi:unnamed protein product [Rhizopus stolonifer]